MVGVRMARQSSTSPEPYGGGARAALSWFLLKAQDTLAGTSVIPNLLALEQDAWRTPEDIQTAKRARLDQHLAYAFEHSPYWRECFGRHGYSPSVNGYEFLSRLPVIGKAELAQHRNGIRPPDFKGRLFTTYSSGSTAERATYWMDAGYYSAVKAQAFRDWKWAGYRIGDPWIWVRAARHKTLKLKARDWGIHCSLVEILQFDASVIARKFEALRGRRFALIRGYPSILVEVARVLATRGIGDIAVGAVVTYGETLFPRDRQILEQTFHARVFDTYGGDMFSVAGQCEEGNYHLHDEWVHVEILDEQDQPLPAGKTGQIVLTELGNKAMPLFRWRINDRGRLKGGSCPCGRGLALMDSVEGRVSDVIVLSGGQTFVVSHFAEFFDLAPGIVKYQAEQVDPDRIILRLKTRPDCDHPLLERKVRQFFADNGAPVVHLQFQYCDTFPLTPTGKFRAVISRVVERHRSGEVPVSEWGWTPRTPSVSTPTSGTPPSIPPR